MPARPSRTRFQTVVAIVWFVAGLFMIAQGLQLLPTIFGDEPMARSQFDAFFGPQNDYDAVLASSPGLYGWRTLWTVVTPVFLLAAGLAWRGGFELLACRRRALRWLTASGVLATITIVVSWTVSSAILARIAQTAFDGIVPPEAEAMWGSVAWINAALQAAPAVVLTRVTWTKRNREGLTAG